MSDELFSIREAVKADTPILEMLTYEEGMGSLPTLDHMFVAINGEGEVIGFIRLAFDDAGVAHVNPIVVYSTWRRYGVGRALIEYAHKKFGELRLVSRGGSRAFYEKLGFAPLPWDMIHEPIAQECNECDMIEECNPEPLHLLKEN